MIFTFYLSLGCPQTTGAEAILYRKIILIVRYTQKCYISLKSVIKPLKAYHVHLNFSFLIPK
jgi:hypothetical protein